MAHQSPILSLHLFLAALYILFPIMVLPIPAVFLSLSLGGFPYNNKLTRSLCYRCPTPLSFTHSILWLPAPRLHHALSCFTFWSYFGPSLIYVKLICNFNIPTCAHRLFILTFTTPPKARCWCFDLHLSDPLIYIM